MLLHIRFIIKYRSPREPQQPLYILSFFSSHLDKSLKGYNGAAAGAFSYQLSHISQNSSLVVSFPIQSNTLLWRLLLLLPSSFFYFQTGKRRRRISKKRKRQSRFLLAITAAPPAAKVVDPLIGKVERRNGQKLGPSKSEEIAKRSREGLDFLDLRSIYFSRELKKKNLIHTGTTLYQ